MEIIAETNAAEAAQALIGGITKNTTTPPSSLTADQQAAIETAVGVLLSQAGIGQTDPVEVSFAANPDGRWAVLRVAVVLQP